MASQPAFNIAAINLAQRAAWQIRFSNARALLGQVSLGAVINLFNGGFQNAN